MPMQYNSFFAAGAGDGSGAGEGFQPASVGEAVAVVADLGEHPGTGQVPQAGEAGDDLGVRAVLNMGDRRLGEIVGGGAGGVNWRSSADSWIPMAFSTCGVGADRCR